MDLSKLTITVKEPDEKFDINFPATEFATPFIIDQIRWFSEKSDIQKMVDFMRENPLKTFEGRLNAAVYCATTASGVGMDLLNHSDQMIRSLYQFHLWYTLKRIFRLTGAVGPSDPGYAAITDKRAYESPWNNDSNWKPQMANGGGELSKWEDLLITRFRVPRNKWAYRFLDPNGPQGFIRTKYGWDNANERWDNHLDKVVSDFKPNKNRWMDYIPKTSPKLLTDVGLAAVGESIMVYVYCVINSQTSGIGITGHSSGAQTAQRRFINLAKTMINRGSGTDGSVTDLVSEFQNSLAKTNRSIDFSLGEGLYLIPSDMRLSDKKIAGLNNMIMRASAGAMGKVIVTPTVHKVLPTVHKVLPTVPTTPTVIPTVPTTVPIGPTIKVGTDIWIATGIIGIGIGIYIWQR